MQNLKIKEMYENGLSTRKIAHILKASTQDVEDTISDNQINILKREWNPESPGQLKHIRDVIALGVSVHTLKSDIYHVSSDTVVRYLGRHNIDYKSSANVHNYDTTVFDNIDSETKAYWLGYVFADGANQAKSLNFLLEEEKFEHLKSLAAFFKDDPSRVEIKDSHAAYKIYSKELFHKLSKLGTSSPKKNNTFPVIRDDLYRHFLRGYLEGKSSLNMTVKSREWRLNISGNLNILQNIVANTLKNGFELKTSANSSGYYAIAISGNQKVYNFCKWLYQGVNIYFDKRFSQIKELEKQLTKIRI